MKVRVSKAFIKTIPKLPKDTQLAVARLITLMEEVDTCTEIPNSKKLKGYKSVYRVRLNDYRVVYIVQQRDTLYLSFIAPRGEVYSKKYSHLIEGL